MSTSHVWPYSRCSSCTHMNRQIRPSGPLNARIMIIGDVVGKWDERDNCPLSGQAGREIDWNYLKLAGLRRADVFCTTLVQCRSLRNDQDVKPTDSLNTVCSANHLCTEIWTVMPEIIILLGAQACALAIDSKLEYEHGFPRQINECPGLYGWSGIVVPMYSPGAGMKDSKFMIPQLEDWELLGQYLDGTWKPPIERVNSINSKAHYFLAETRDDVQWYFALHGDCLEHQMPRILAIDSESDEGRDWSIQVSIEFGTGLMVLLDNKDAINELSMFVHDRVAHDWVIVFHQEQADIDLCERLGIDCTIHRDTMSELYHLGNLPQGLKAAVYRTLGKKMRSYIDVVLPHSKEALSNWLAEGLNYATDHMAETLQHPVGKNCPSCGKTHRKDVSKHKPHECEAVIRRVLKYVEENNEYDPWIKAKTATNGDVTMRLFGRSWLPILEQQIGRMPRASIVHVPLNEAKDYGCSDADHTGQLAYYLEKERDRIVKEEWRTA